MKIYLGSTSQLKYEALQDAFSFVKSKSLLNHDVEIITKTVDSGVPATPNDNETYIGAKK